MTGSALLLSDAPHGRALGGCTFLSTGIPSAYVLIGFVGMSLFLFSLTCFLYLLLAGRLSDPVTLSSDPSNSSADFPCSSSSSLERQTTTRGGVLEQTGLLWRRQPMLILGSWFPRRNAAGCVGRRGGSFFRGDTAASASTQGCFSFPPSASSCTEEEHEDDRLFFPSGPARQSKGFSEAGARSEACRGPGPDPSHASSFFRPFPPLPAEPVHSKQRFRDEPVHSKLDKSDLQSDAEAAKLLVKRGQRLREKNRLAKAYSGGSGKCLARWGLYFLLQSALWVDLSVRSGRDPVPLFGAESSRVFHKSNWELILMQSGSAGLLASVILGEFARGFPLRRGVRDRILFWGQVSVFVAVFVYIVSSLLPLVVGEGPQLWLLNALGGVSFALLRMSSVCLVGGGLYVMGFGVRAFKGLGYPVEVVQKKREGERGSVDSGCGGKGS
uniref:Transmembrane protein n=1 Tax=Chromera velia CCMP2878 TaxID=1169474 RepID=A0A0G4G8F2_9ALVE|eukprot:Cvel_4290.t1-p1 / transcript=Cvel_4290.t1 / gene=Cvel_4290 / organism=Chromera_velia_CCMP2878 / gene_product=hypothetical protein / transcript_product=hypothetical protein / location=Cvel_scaffold186:42151-46856(+) / protein_length=440 / sequence_SO=supercontig / SO=protein_coding / is_pseudo=false